MAERMGFEPMEEFDPLTHFPGELLRPLRHLSALDAKHYSLLSALCQSSARRFRAFHARAATASRLGGGAECAEEFFYAFLRFAAKNSVSSAAHSSASRPPVTRQRWYMRGSRGIS